MIKVKRDASCRTPRSAGDTAVPRRKTGCTGPGPGTWPVRQLWWTTPPWTSSSWAAGSRRATSSRLPDRLRAMRRGGQSEPGEQVSGERDLRDGGEAAGPPRDEVIPAVHRAGPGRGRLTQVGQVAAVVEIPGQRGRAEPRPVGNRAAGGVLAQAGGVDHEGRRGQASDQRRTVRRLVHAA